jgi:hypothetical protein
VKDYTILNLSNHNILCLGGAVSIDKEKKIKDNAFWYNEAFVFNEKSLKYCKKHRYCCLLTMLPLIVFLLI